MNPSLRRNIGLLLLLSAVPLTIHLIYAGRYGYFRDEMYMWDCGRHLAWGYVDHAPLTPWLHRLNETLFGHSLRAFRLLPAISSALKTILTGLLVLELGGGTFAICLASLAVMVAPVFLAIDSQFSLNTFEPLFWIGCLLALLISLRKRNGRILLCFGLLAGLGIENKHSFLFFGAALALALLVSPERRIFRERWIWIAAAAALLLFLPNLIWQAAHGWPTLEFLLAVSRTHKNVELPPGPFLLEQLFMVGPINAMIWIPGLLFLLLRKRFLGLTYLFLLVMLMALHGKDYYLAPIYPVLFAAGAVAWESWTRGRAWARATVAALVLIVSLPTVPVVLPVLPPGTLVRYLETLHISPPRTELKHTGPLPQHFGDEFGWPEMTAQIADLYRALPPDEQSRTAILAGNYGEAAAIDLFGPPLGLPPASSAHNTFWFWGPHPAQATTLIVLQYGERFAVSHCASVTPGMKIQNPWSMDEEQFTPYVCHGFHPPLAEAWPSLKHWP